MKKIIPVALAALLLIQGCGNMSNFAKGSLIGAGGGAAVGAGIGALIGNGRGAAIGAAVGTAVGAGAGAAIGKKMDRKAAELEAALAEANVETVEDVNGLTSIKITFPSGILFPTGKSALSEDSKIELAKFAGKISDMQDTDITIYGHTDNTGSAAINEKLSLERAQSVSTYLQKLGISSSRMFIEGKSFNEPVASNETVEGRAMNRRVEIYITANENMIKAAQEGNL